MLYLKYTKIVVRSVAHWVSLSLWVELYLLLSSVYTSRHRISTQAGKIGWRVFAFKRWRLSISCKIFFDGMNNIKAQNVFTIFIKIRVKIDSIKSSIKEFYLKFMSMFGYFDRKKNQITIYLIQYWMFFSWSLWRLLLERRYIESESASVWARSHDSIHLFRHYYIVSLKRSTLFYWNLSGDDGTLSLGSFFFTNINTILLTEFKFYQQRKRAGCLILMIIIMYCEYLYKLFDLFY